jgi:ABC-2 type transport system ATP-binding protein
LAEQGLHLIISSHVLHEVDVISDQVVLLSNGYVVAEGEIRGVRDEIREQPMQILIRCNKPGALASQVFLHDYVVEARVLHDGRGQNGIDIESVAPADDDVLSVYEYLIGTEEPAQ